MTNTEHLTPPKPTPDDRDRNPRNLPRATGVRPWTNGGRPSNARTEQGSSSGFPGNRSVGSEK